MELWPLRTLLLAIFLLMTMTWHLAHSEDGGDRGQDRGDGDKKKKKKDGDHKDLEVDPILRGIIQGNRRVLLLAAFPNTSIAIVSASKTASLDGAVLVDITLKDKKVFFNSAMLLKDKWPQVNMPDDGQLALIRDDTGLNLLIAGNLKLHQMSLSTPTLPTEFTVQPYDTYSKFFQSKMLITSMEKMVFYSMECDPTNIIARGNFYGDRLADCTQMSPRPDNRFLPGDICMKVGSKFYVSMVLSCTTYMKWKITTGFISQTDVFLVDMIHQEIITFKGTVFPIGENYPTPYTTIKFKKFWKKGKKPKEDAPPAPGNDSIRVRPKSSTSNHKGYWIAAGVVLLVILILALITAGVALYMCGKSKKKDKAAAAAAASKSKEGVKKKASKHKEHHKMAVIVVQSKQNAAAGKVTSKGSVQNVGKKPSKRSQQSKRRACSTQPRKASSGQVVSKKVSKRATSSR